MDDLLTKAALIELAKAQKALLINETYRVKITAGWVKSTLAWCRENEITLGQTNVQYCHITRDGIAAIERRYHQMGFGTISAHIEAINGNRIAAAKVSANEKLAKDLPTEHLVLVASLDLSMRLSQQSLAGLTNTPSQVNLEIDVNYIDLSLFDYLIVIENRDCFNHWYEYETELSHFRLLIVYRGHEKSHSKACENLKARWFKEKGKIGLVYFGDFDIAGLSIPINSKTTYQHCLLPELKVLSSLLLAEHYSAEDAYRLRSLSQQCPEKWQPMLNLLLEKEQGLRQQWMLGHMLKLF